MSSFAMSAGNLTEFSGSYVYYTHEKGKRKVFLRNKKQGVGVANLSSPFHTTVVPKGGRKLIQRRLGQPTITQIAMAPRAR